MLPNSLLDYRFAWRWLLPILRGDQMLLLGYSEEETEFWRHAFADVELTDDASKASICLVNGLSAAIVANVNFKQLRTLCVVGTGKVVKSWSQYLPGYFAKASEYAMLPASNPRLVLPLENRAWLLQSLGLHRPGRLLARVLIAITKILASVGVDRPLRTRMLYIASRQSGNAPHGAIRAGLNSHSEAAPCGFALYLGTPDDNRKTVILPLGHEVSIILKQGDSSKAKAALRREAAALEFIRGTSLAACVPALVKVVETDESVTLQQEYRPRVEKDAVTLSWATHEFLASLSKLNAKVARLDQILASSKLMGSSEARAQGLPAYGVIREKLNELALAGTTLWGHRSHGDFAPWNFTWTKQGFFVFDWEESKEWDVAFGDTFYRVLGPAALVATRPDLAAVEQQALSTAEALVTETNVKSSEIRIYWAYWLLRRSSSNPAPLYEQLLERLVISGL